MLPQKRRVEEASCLSPRRPGIFRDIFADDALGAFGRRKVFERLFIAFEILERFSEHKVHDRTIVDRKIGTRELGANPADQAFVPMK